MNFLWIFMNFYEFLWIFMNFYEFFMNFYDFFVYFMNFYGFLTYFCLLWVYFYDTGPRSMEIVSPLANVIFSVFFWTVGASTTLGYSSFTPAGLHGWHFRRHVRELCPNSPQIPHFFCFFSGSFSKQVRLLCPHSPQSEHWRPLVSFFVCTTRQVRELWPLPPQLEQVFSLDLAFS